MPPPVYYDPAPAITPPHGESGGQGIEPPQILVVEDEPHLQRVLAQTLAQIGYRVEIAGTVAEAIAAALQRPPDVLVLDNNLPDGTGWTVLRVLAGRGLTGATLPTIMMSAGPPERRRVAEFRPHAFLPKPFPIAALTRLIGDALAGRGAVAPAPRDGSSEAPRAHE